LSELSAPTEDGWRSPYVLRWWLPCTLGALGVRCAGLLGRVCYVSSVSDGSLANGLYAPHLEELEGGFTSAALDELLRPALSEPDLAADL